MREALQCVLLFLFCVLSTSMATAQTFVLDQAVWNDDFTLPYRDYGSGISFFDVNNDGFDDVTFPQKNDSIILFLSNGTEFTPIKLMYIIGEAKQPIWVDFDNDGDYDLFISVHEGQSRLFRNDGDFQFTDLTVSSGLIPTYGYLCYGASFGDYNNDGWLDLYLNVYDYGSNVGNFLLRNNAGVNFSNVTNAMGASVSSDYSFQSTMIDWDFDGDVDIHVANDRAPRDGYYTNQNQFFTNDFSSAGLDLVSNSMSSSWADFDHDGDMDFYVTNTPSLTNDLWKKNESGYYDQVGDELHVGMERWCWGALWIDFDNNTWEDLYVANYANPDDEPPFFINQSGLDFTQENIVQNPSVVDAEWGYAPAKGDFNGDGLYDIAVNAFDGAAPKFYRNTTDESKWVKVKLRGTISNRDAAGTRVEYYVDGARLIRHHLIGTNYMGQDSQWLILGLGEADQIDSLQCFWPSGIVSTFYNLPSETVTVLIEGQEFVPLLDSTGQPITSLNIQLCEGESIEITSTGFNQYTWNDGTEGNAIIISEPGEYFVTAINELGLENVSSHITVSWVADAFETVNVADVSCTNGNDGSIGLNGNGQWSYSIYQDGENITQWNQLAAGEYHIEATYNNNCFAETTITITEPAPIVVNWNQEGVSCWGNNDGAIVLENSSGGTGMLSVQLWDASETLIEPENWMALEAGSYFAFVTDENGCENNAVIDVASPDALQIDVAVFATGDFTISADGGTPPYQIVWNGIPIPNNYSGAFTEEINAFEIIDSNGCLLQESVAFVGTDAQNESKHFIQNRNGNIFCFPSSVENIELLDMAGRRVKYATNVNAISIADLADGTYLIKVCWKDSEVLSFKFINNDQSK